MKYRNHQSYLFVLAFLCSFQWAFGQHYSEILQYATTEANGSARTVGVGAGLSALGADMGAITQNPAGLARYRRSEMNITIGLDNISTDATFGTNTTNTTKSLMQLPSVGMVFTSRPENIKWKTMNFSVGYNRQLSYNRNAFFEGSATGSIIQKFAAEANGLGLDELDGFGAGLAYDALGIYDDDGDKHYESDFDGVVDSFYHAQDFSERGNMGEITVALAGNYEDRLSIGLSIGIPVLSLQKEKSYEEIDKDSSILYFDRLKFDESVKTTGAGFNLKLGMIYQINQAVRAGLAIHSPTWLNLNDSFSNTFNYEYTDANGPSANEKNSEQGVFEYKVVTPWRAVGSLGAIIARKGFISADVELVDYTTGRFNLTSDLKTPETQELEKENNKAIKKNYRQAFNFRVGGEYAMDAFRFRAGLGLYGSPIINDDTYKMIYSAGLGYRKDDFFVDLAYRLNQSTEGYSPYDGDFMKPNGAVLKTQRSTIALTLGVKF